MLWIYDDAISKDLENSFDTDVIGAPVVKVMDAETGIAPIAQQFKDSLPLPLVILTRHPDTGIDESRLNFTRLHKGVVSVMDPKTNNLYYEKALPVDVRYSLTVLAANTVDRDELTRELIFKYSDMYFITTTIPYESKRKVRFGVRIDTSSEISNSSGSVEYYSEGKLYESIIPLVCEGCVLVSYTPAKLKRSVTDVAIDTPDPNLK